MAGATLPQAEQLELIALVDDYVFGFSLREAVELAGQGEPDMWPPGLLEFFAGELGSGEYPRIAEVIGDDTAAGWRRIFAILGAPERFERGLQTLLDGVAARIA